MFNFLPRSTRILHLLSLALSLFVLVSLPACKTTQTQTGKTQGVVFELVKTQIIDELVPLFFGDSAIVDKKNVNLEYDFSIDFIKTKVIKNKKVRDFLSPRGGLIAYTMYFDSYLKWERTLENKVRIKAFYKEYPKPDSLNRQGSLLRPSPALSYPTASSSNSKSFMTKQEIAQIVEQHRETCKALGYAFFERGNYNLNGHAIREDNVFDNKFSDKFRLIYKENNEWRVFETKWTTLAGTLGHGGEQRPLTGAETGTGVSGVAVIVPSQYRRVFKFVDNYWQWLGYPFYQQIGNMQYWRDNDRNGIITQGKVYTGNYATNLHRMGNNRQEKDWVNSSTEWWSQGCNGAPEPQFAGILPIMRASIKAGHGDIMSYTLFDRSQLVS